MSYSILDVQKSVDDILTSDSTLLNLLNDGVNSILDNPIKSNTLDFPYIFYSSINSQEWDTQTSTGAECYITISVFSNSGDRLEATTILSRIYTLLHNQDLSVSNNNFVLCRWDGLSEVFIDDNKEGRIIQGVIRFMIITQGV
jgi:hypothetical protein